MYLFMAILKSESIYRYKMYFYVFYTYFEE